MRPARTPDVPAIKDLVEPLVQRRILLGKESVVFYESVQEFRVAVDETGALIGCGALHVMWQDLGEVRTLAVADEWLHHGVGHAILSDIESTAVGLGLSRLFCLDLRNRVLRQPTVSRRSARMSSTRTSMLQLVRSSDEGIAEFLDLSRVKPNTLGNTRMLKRL